MLFTRYSSRLTVCHCQRRGQFPLVASCLELSANCLRLRVSAVRWLFPRISQGFRVSLAPPAKMDLFRYREIGLATVLARTANHTRTRSDLRYLATFGPQFAAQLSGGHTMSTNHGRAALPTAMVGLDASWHSSSACAAKPGRRVYVCDYSLQREGRGPRLLMGR